MTKKHKELLEECEYDHEVAVSTVKKLLHDLERLQEELNTRIANHEAQWYDCHDGSEGACCKAHE